MKSALEIVAFSKGCEVSGIAALAEILIEKLDQGGHGMAALYVQMAYDTYIIRESETADRELAGISELG